ncbi:MAG: PilZ domain-containing protein [Sphingomonadales bacterium]|nr:PilZ domain-containing protein [Sphingomonadales bacterium]MBP7135808.1 PilZ domain-containing protein [Sphingomonadaceae bacterium]MBK6493191.1 PilZ domain-containing protein [Sphingomonadales bacterium]MBK6719943.1 PilZ domain-containing protein [Sphingomonadales bacterium]MBK8271633.1 PilZ domain-containing protein [Sphingomonadales bacterium]
MAMQLVRAPEFAESEKFETAERRYAVVLSAQITPESEDTPISVRVCNISAGGLMAIVPPHVALRGQVSIMIRHVGKLIGRIVWAQKDRIGVRFDAEIDPVALLAERAERAAAPSLLANRFVELTKKTMAVPGMDFPIERPLGELRAA